MIVSNELNNEYFVETVRMLLGVVAVSSSAVATVIGVGAA